MALTPEPDQTFLREVDEELRRTQLKSFWSRYGLLVAGLVVLAALAAGGWAWWQARQRAAAEREAETLVTVLTDLGENRPQGSAPKIAALARSPREGYRAAALFTQAGVALAERRDADAVAAYRAIAGDAKLARPYRELALLRQTTLEFDRLPPAQVVQRLRPLAAAGSPWRGSAGELVGAALLIQGKGREAAPVFAGIAGDPTVPETIRARATQMAGSLGVDATPRAGAANDANTDAR